MALENADQIWELVPSNPTSSDPVSEGDNHIRMIKASLQNSLPGMSGPWKTSSPINAGDPVLDQDLVTKKFLSNYTLIPGIGFPFIWLLPTFPDPNILDLDGRAISRADYAELFNLYGVTYGAGDGTTTFNIPDCRGYFLRVQDQGAGRDPDAATRTARADGVAGDNVGTTQADELKSHEHSGGNGTILYNTGGGGSIGSSGSLDREPMLSVGGSETRPKNINVRLVIRAK